MPSVPCQLPNIYLQSRILPWTPIAQNFLLNSKIVELQAPDPQGLLDGWDLTLTMPQGELSTLPLPKPALSAPSSPSQEIAIPFFQLLRYKNSVASSTLCFYPIVDLIHYTHWLKLKKSSKLRQFFCSSVATTALHLFPLCEQTNLSGSQREPINISQTALLLWPAAPYCFSSQRHVQVLTVA